MVAKGYARTYQTQSVITASPGQLVLMLYDGALKFMGNAREAMPLIENDPRNIETVNRNLQKAQNIICELQDTLNREQGGEFAANMYRLYDYYNRRLLEANLKKDPKIVAEVERLFREIRDGWAEMLRREESSSVVSSGSGVRGVA